MDMNFLKFNGRLGSRLCMAEESTCRREGMPLCFVDGGAVDREYQSARADAQRLVIPNRSFQGCITHYTCVFTLQRLFYCGDGSSLLSLCPLHATPLSMNGLTSYPTNATMFTKPPITTSSTT